MLSSLTELTIKGTMDYFQTLVLYQSVINNIILNSNQISRLCFRDIVIEEKNSVNDKIGDSVCTLMKYADDIKELSLINAYAKDFGFFHLPRHITAFKRINSNCVVLNISFMIILRNWY